MSETKELQLRQTSRNGKARASSMRHLPKDRLAHILLSYHSSGRLLIVGPYPKIAAAASQFESNSEIQCVLLATELNTENKKSNGDSRAEIYLADNVSISGHLGNFIIEVTRNNHTTNFADTLSFEPKTFDLVQDICSSPIIESEIPPPGYYATEGEEQKIASSAEEISNLIGKFEKPKFFNYNPDICAHGRSGLIGCSRCLDSCPTDAIASVGDTIEVDPYLCQGVGACTTVCPTGAITYAHPAVETLIESIRNMLNAYRDAEGQSPSLLFYDCETGREVVQSCASSLPQNVIPIEIEEIGAVGLDLWLACIAYGSSSISLLCTPSIPKTVVVDIETQISFCDALVQGAGHPPGRVQIIKTDSKANLIPLLKVEHEQMPIEPANFVLFGEKRADIRRSLDHLFALTSPHKKIATLPEGAPFGGIEVDTKTCTLCLACVSVCPASALEADGEMPKLSFIEWNCVQCGLCETACPESAISLKPRYVYNLERLRSRTLNEDVPMRCIGCGKPFATRSMLFNIQSKLKDHWMFQDPDAVKRLEMCEDCRVKDMFLKENSQL